MRPAHVYARISAEQHTELITALHGQWRTATRMVIVVLSAAGWTASEIADLLHYDPKTVRAWIRRHHNEGLAGLPDRPRPGRPRKGSPRLGQRIQALLATPRTWTTARIWRALGRPTISLTTMRRRIREQARWAPPRLIAKSDPHHDQICADIRDQITALPEGAVVLAEDETHLDLLARVHACWMPVGLRHRVLTPGTNIRRTIHGAVNLVTGAFHHHVSVKNVSVVFCYFLQQLLDTYPNAPIIAVICDNGSTHHSNITKRWLAGHPRIRVIEGAKYSPQDNPAERIRAAPKRQLANTAVATITDRIHQAGGLVDEGEEPAQAAAREIEEETGYRPRSIEHLVTFEPMIGMVNSPHHVFLARGADQIGEPTERTEMQRMEWVRLADVPGLIARGEIGNSGTLVALLHVLAISGSAAPYRSEAA